MNSPATAPAHIDGCPVHTPELRNLFDAMRSANKRVEKLTNKIGLLAIRSEEYKAAKAAWRTYWDAVDADKNAKDAA